MVHLVSPRCQGKEAGAAVSAVQDASMQWDAAGPARVHPSTAAAHNFSLELIDSLASARSYGAVEVGEGAKVATAARAKRREQIPRGQGYGFGYTVYWDIAIKIIGGIL